MPSARIAGETPYHCMQTACQVQLHITPLCRANLSAHTEHPHPDAAPQCAGSPHGRPVSAPGALRTRSTSHSSRSKSRQMSGLHKLWSSVNLVVASNILKFSMQFIATSIEVVRR